MANEAPPRAPSVGGESAPGAGPITLTLSGDRRDVEAVALEFHRLAKANGLEIGSVRVRPADEPSGDDETERRSG